MNAEIDKNVSSPSLSDANVPIDKAVPFVFSTYFQGKLRLFADRLPPGSASVLHNAYNPGVGRDLRPSRAWSRAASSTQPDGDRAGQTRDPEAEASL